MDLGPYLHLQRLISNLDNFICEQGYVRLGIWGYVRKAISGYVPLAISLVYFGPDFRVCAETFRVCAGGYMRRYVRDPN